MIALSVKLEVSLLLTLLLVNTDSVFINNAFKGAIANTAFIERKINIESVLNIALSK